MRDIGSHAPHLKAMGRPKALGNRRFGRTGEPAVGESVGASESLDDVPQDPRLPSYPPVGPTDRLHDLYGSLSTRLGMRLFRRLPIEPHDVTWFWVKGHAGHPENERADELARHAIGALE